MQPTFLLRVSFQDNKEEESGKKGDGGKKSSGAPGNNAMRILVLAQKGDWTACESALKALERSTVDDGGPKAPLAAISDNVSQYICLK